ncbi:hypothetical protein J6590_041064 [Homalodisca vitripennis]|nr:hypothetical protein J6590_041064 [Homalodisca vitripennis]
MICVRNRPLRGVWELKVSRTSINNGRGPGPGLGQDLKVRGGHLAFTRGDSHTHTGEPRSRLWAIVRRSLSLATGVELFIVGTRFRSSKNMLGSSSRFQEEP